MEEKTGQVEEDRCDDHLEWTYNVLAIVMLAVQNQGDHQNEGIQSTTLDRVPDQASIESIQLVIRSELCGFLGLPNSPDNKTGDDDVGHERDGEESWGNIGYPRDEGGLTRRQVGKFPDRNRDQCL